MTPITSIFGKYLRPFFEYFGEYERKTVHGLDEDTETNQMKGSMVSQSDIVFVRRLYQAHTFLSQPMDIGYFVSPPKAVKENYIYDNGFCKEDYDLDNNAHQNWQPLFKGEWEVDTFITVNGNYTGCWVDSEGKILDESGHEVKTLNDFATHCKKAGIELELNEDYQIQ